MRSLATVALSLMALLCWSGDAAAQARTFKVDSKGGSKIQFVSDAPLETITGVTSKLSGTITVDPAKPAGGKASIDAAVASIRTNNDLRDEHLRGEDWLDAAKHPKATFVLTSVSGLTEIKPNTGYTATIKGKFTIHGVTQNIETKAKLRLSPGKGGKPDQLRIQASFMVNLVAHKVSVPSIVRLKVAKDIKVNVDLRASAS